MIDKILNGMLRNKKSKTRSAVGVAVAAYASRIPQKASEMLYGQLTSKIVLPEESRHFSTVCAEIQKNAMSLSYSSTVVGYGDTATIGYGTTWSRLDGSIVMVERKDDDKKKSKVEITFFLTPKDKAVEIIKGIIKRANTRDDDTEEIKRVDIYTTHGGSLEFVKSDIVRERDSVFIDRTTLDYIDRRVDEFLGRRTWYEKRGIPYKYAILLHGNPGTGKSTLAKYIAGRIDRALMVVNPIEFNALVRHLSGNVALMEDMDCDMFINLSRTHDAGNPMFSLGELLNSMDGVNSVTNCIIIGTTNHLEKIDDALLRKGRFDDVIEIKPLPTEEVIRMVKFFFDDDALTGFAKNYKPITGAVLQDMIMNHLNEGPEVLIKVLNKTHKIS